MSPDPELRQYLAVLLYRRYSIVPWTAVQVDQETRDNNEPDTGSGYRREPQRHCYRH